QMPNYFFQSALFILILHLAFPSFRDLARDQGGSSGILMRILNTEIALFFGISCTLAAINLTVWGVHHQTSFLFSLINAVFCMLYAGFRLSQKEKALEEEEDYTVPPGYEDEFEDDLDADFPADDDASDSIVPRFNDDFEEPMDISDDAAPPRRRGRPQLPDDDLDV
ncbi:MAG: hypothetical protein KDK37_09465, partial [Leptospiraceae bacterium]|nr:hypothetical protein [Leptospiraceae bacterium]